MPSKPTKLTDVAIKQALAATFKKALTTRRRVRIWDHGGHGLYLGISPAGGALWRLNYRMRGVSAGDGKSKLVERLLALGKYPTVSLAEARKRRDAALASIADGIDPSAKRKADKVAAAGRAANSFEAVAREWYGKRAHIWVEHHASDVMRRLEASLFPEIGAMPIAEIGAPTRLAAVRKIEHRGAHDLAHRVLQVASQVFRYGVATGRCERDPAPDLRGALTPHKGRNQAAVKPEELPALLRAIDGYGDLGGRQTALALRLLCVTFVRTGELIGATWDEVNLDGAVWIIPAERMKMRTEHVVPLSRQALDVLHELRTLGTESRYVRNPDKPISNNTLLFALYRLGYKGKMTGHGFRAVASTMLNEAGFRADVIERQLAHCERNDVRGAYNRAEYLAERQTMMQQWVDTVDALTQGAKVVPLRRAARR